MGEKTLEKQLEEAEAFLKECTKNKSISAIRMSIRLNATIASLYKKIREKKEGEDNG